MSILLFSNLLHTKVEVKTIVEIGGGYGNWLYLNQNKKFNKWIIIDLPHVIELQKYYLTHTNVDLNRVSFVSAYNYSEVESEKIDIVIGTHSLSELSLDIFDDYFRRVISKSKYLLYCFHKFMPTIELINAKKDIIDTQFTLVKSIISEKGNVYNCFYINKNYV
jgi:putative sugar O-methyltransferase